MDILSAGMCDIWRNLHRRSPMMKNMKSGNMRIFQSCHQSVIIRIAEETRKQFTILKNLMERENAKSCSSAYGFLQWNTRRFRMAFLISKMERHILWYIKFWTIMGKNIQHLKLLPRREKQKNEKRKLSISSLSKNLKSHSVLP